MRAALGRNASSVLPKCGSSDQTEDESDEDSDSPALLAIVGAVSRLLDLTALNIGRIEN